VKTEEQTAKFINSVQKNVTGIGNATRVPENPGNPPVFKPVNPGLCAGKNPGLTGLISVSVSTQYTAEKSVQKRKALNMWQNILNNSNNKIPNYSFT